MGEEFTMSEDEDRVIYMKVMADKPVKRLMLVKNSEKHVPF